MSSASVFHITWWLFEWAPSLYILKIVIVPAVMVIDAATTSWEPTVICCQELVSKCLLKNVTAHDFLGLLLWVKGSRGYHLWLACVLARKSMYSSWSIIMSHMLGLMELMRSCWAMSNLLRFCCHTHTIVRLLPFSLFIGL